jgi:hypothetical protein
MASSTTSAISCNETSYTTPKGLGFSFYCNSDQTDIGDIDNAGADNVEDCMNQCSTHPDRLCGAAAFDSTTLRCFFKNASVTSDGAVTRDGWLLGIANETQLQPVAGTCSNDRQTQTTQNGLEFSIYCDETVVGYDLCPDSAPDCRVHTNTFKECLEFCSTTRPLCTGIAWDPTLKLGYQNCYPKIASAQMFDNARSSSSDGLRCAKALLEPANDDCHTSTNATTTASNKETFELSCEESRTGNNITAQHAASLSNCIDSCTNYTASSCLGTVFDAKMVNGFENCYLKSAIGNSVLDQTGFTFAKRQFASNDSASVTLSPAQSHRGNNAWIAYPIIVVIAFIIAAVWWWWWRRNSRSKKVQDVQNGNTLEEGLRATAELFTYAPTHELEQKPKARAELDPADIYAGTYELDPQSKIHVIHEIGPGSEPSSTPES